MKLPGYIIFLLTGFFLFSACDKTPDPQPPGEVYDPTPYELIIPQGFPDMVIPGDNPMTV